MPIKFGKILNICKKILEVFERNLTTIESRFCRNFELQLCGGVGGGATLRKFWNNFSKFELKYNNGHLRVGYSRKFLKYDCIKLSSRLWRNFILSTAEKPLQRN